jgi:hypothetical protein
MAGSIDTLNVAPFPKPVTFNQFVPVDVEMVEGNRLLAGVPDAVNVTVTSTLADAPGPDMVMGSVLLVMDAPEKVSWALAVSG